MEELQKEIGDCFVDLQHKKAFDLLYNEAWRPEEAVMGNYTLPTVLDKLVMVGNINVRKLVGEVSDQIKKRRAKIEELDQRTKLLEEKFASAESRIKNLDLDTTVEK